MSIDQSRAFIAVSINTHNSLKAFADERGYTIGGFAERAIMEKIDAERKREKRSQSKAKKNA